MRKCYYHDTEAGTFYIAESHGRFQVMFNEVSLGNYPTAENAAEGVAKGMSLSSPAGLDTSKLGLPERLSEWHPLEDWDDRGPER